MFLAIDIGNTETTVGVFVEDSLKFQWAIETKAARTADQLAAFLLPLLSHNKIVGQWEGGALCSVVPSAVRGAMGFTKRYLGFTPFQISPGNDLPFSLNVKEPNTVGADRLANSAYAITRLKLPAIVVDFGTATTLDVISASKSYEGGVILPGIGMALETLNQKTSQLSVVEPIFPDSVLGKSTAECIQAGVLFGYCDQINGLIQRTEKELGEKCTIRLTGGYACLFADKIPQAQVAKELTLEGIRILHRQLV